MLISAHLRHLVLFISLREMAYVSWHQVKPDSEYVTVQQRFDGPIILRLRRHRVLQDYYPGVDVWCAGLQFAHEAFCRSEIDLAHVVSPGLAFFQSSHNEDIVSAMARANANDGGDAKVFVKRCSRFPQSSARSECCHAHEALEGVVLTACRSQEWTRFTTRPMRSVEHLTCIIERYQMTSQETSLAVQDGCLANGGRL